MIVVLDFGGQYNQLIARRIRDLGVYSELLPYNTSADKLRELAPKGIVFSGGPASVYADNAPQVDPGVYAAETYLCGEVLEEALKQVKGNIEDKNTFMKALKGVNLKESLRGPMHFDQYGNVVGNLYIRKVERRNGKLVNAVVKTYPDVSQFWTYKPEEFLKAPVYSRDFPPAKNLEP